MKTDKTASSLVMSIGILISIAAGVLIWLMAHQLATGLLVCGAGLILSVLIAAFVQKQSNSEKKSKKDQKKISSLVDIQSVSSLQKAVHRTNPKSLKKEMRELENQTIRMEKKAQLLDQALATNFPGSAITRAKFAATINDVFDLYSRTVNDIIKRVNLFDQDGYEQLFVNHLEYTDSIAPYQKEIDAVKASVEKNEQILKMMDRLLHELNSLSEEDTQIETLPEIEELQTLTRQTALYRDNDALEHQSLPRT